MTAHDEMQSQPLKLLSLFSEWQQGNFTSAQSSSSWGHIINLTPVSAMMSHIIVFKESRQNKIQFLAQMKLRFDCINTSLKLQMRKI